ncbi:MAG: DUF445 family protein [Polaromonas sp.]|nr:DUF445 family protein [Polaromonas sp.]
MTKETELKQAKSRALLLLLAATASFVITVFLPRSAWVDALKAISEAAMVGGLADWFAVAALFTRIPTPFPFISSRTAVIPNAQKEIADNLAVFVQEKFLNLPSLVGLIRKHDPAQKIADWLVSPVHADQLGRHIVQLLGGMLDFVEDAQIQKFIREAMHALIEKVDLSKSAGAVLDNLTKDGRHQELLNGAIEQLAVLLREPETGRFIAQKIVQWLKNRHPLKEKILPSEWIGEHGAELMASAIHDLLADVGNNPAHQLRVNFDEVVKRLISRLKSDPAFLEKGAEIKRYLQNDENFNLYIGELWGELRDWLKRDLSRPDSVLHRRVMAAGQWVGNALAQDAALRVSLNLRMEDAARKIAPDFAEFLTRHISDTVKNWDAGDMSRQIELNIGKDLQAIRINGTFIGGIIGGLLHLFSLLPDLLQWLAA